MSNESTEPVVFDLDQSRQAPSAGAKTIQHRAWAEIADRLERRNKVLENLADSDSRTRLDIHDAILLDGSRGSGKTTFLHGLKSALQTEAPATKPDNAIAERLAKVGRHLHILPPFDPTLIESAEHPVVTLVERIDFAVGKQRDLDAGHRTAYERALKDLADSLSVLENVGKDRLYDGWEDGAVVAQRSLRRAKSGVRLAERLDPYLKSAAAALGKRAFFVVFDDIDTQFDRGWPVLEAIRKYLTSPRIIVLVAGDLSLYSLLTRRAQLQNLGGDLLRYDRAHRDHHPVSDLVEWQDDPLKKMVDGLEAQYLLKVLMPENRVTLRTLAAIERDSPQSLLLQSGDKNLGTLADAIDTIFKKSLHLRRPEHLQEHREAIMRQPVRTVAQFLQAGIKLLEAKDPTADDQAVYLKDFRQRFASIAASPLNQFGIRHIDVNEANPVRLSGMVVRWFEDARLWEDGPALRPRYGEDDKNLVAIAFAMRFTEFFEQSIGHAYAYFVRVCLTRVLVLQAEDAEVRRRLLAFLDVSTERDLADSARRWVVAQRELLSSNEAAALGTIPVITSRTRVAKTAIKALYNIETGTDSVSRTILTDVLLTNYDKYKGPAKGHLDAWLEMIGDRTDSLALDRTFYTTPDRLIELLAREGQLIHIATTISTKFGARYTTLSSVVLLGTLGDCVLRKRGLLESDLVESRPIGSPGFYGSRRPDDPKPPDPKSPEAAEVVEDGDDEAGTSPQISPAGAVPLPFELETNLFRGAGVPPQLVASAADRFWATLNALDDGLSYYQQYTGALVDQQLVALENSFLVEELLFRTDGRTKGQAVSLKSPVRGDEFLESNRRVALRLPAKDPLSLFVSFSDVSFLQHFRVPRQDRTPPAPGVALVGSAQTISLAVALNSIPVANKLRGRWPKVVSLGAVPPPANSPSSRSGKGSSKVGPSAPAAPPESQTEES